MAVTKRGRGRRGNVALITDARRSINEHYHIRRKVYAWLQIARVPLLLGAVVSLMAFHNEVLAMVMLVISVPLPWVAVVFANEQHSKPDKRHVKVYKPAEARRQRAAAEHDASLPSASTAGALSSGMHTGKEVMVYRPQRVDHTGYTVIDHLDD